MGLRVRFLTSKMSSDYCGGGGNKQPAQMSEGG